MKLESRWIDNAWHYFLNGKEVSEERYDAAKARNKQRGKRFKPPGCFGDTGNWEGENVGKGRYCPQLARFPKDPKAYARTRHDLIKYAQKRGLGVEKE